MAHHIAGREPADPNAFHPIQQAMRDAHGFQCGFCAPGFLMTTKALLDVNPAPTPDDLREELSGNLCRCTGYASILAGAEAAVAKVQASRAAATSEEGASHA